MLTGASSAANGGSASPLLLPVSLCHRYFAKAATPGDQTNMTRAIIELKQHEHAAKASMQTLATADKMLGTLLDVKA